MTSLIKCKPCNGHGADLEAIRTDMDQYDGWDIYPATICPHCKGTGFVKKKTKKEDK